MGYPDFPGASGTPLRDLAMSRTVQATTTTPTTAKASLAQNVLDVAAVDCDGECAAWCLCPDGMMYVWKKQADAAAQPPPASTEPAQAEATSTSSTTVAQKPAELPGHRMENEQLTASWSDRLKIRPPSKVLWLSGATEQAAPEHEQQPSAGSATTTTTAAEIDHEEQHSTPEETSSSRVEASTSRVPPTTTTTSTTTITSSGRVLLDISLDDNSPPRSPPPTPF